MMPVWPGSTPCLRCVFPEPPGPGELPTCDTAGVLGPAAAMVASLQAATAIQMIVGATGRTAACRTSSSGSTCGGAGSGRRRWTTPAGRTARPAANGGSSSSTRPAAGRAGPPRSAAGNAVQVRPAVNARLDLTALAGRLAAAGAVQQTPHLLRCALSAERDVSLTVFPDGRAIVHGTSDPARARSVYARWVGA
jgi:adenylyltransferase/sulfurtransferase